MAKRKRVDINNQVPLQSVTIGKVSEHKFGWMGILLLFGLFAGIIYFLPDISIMIEKYKDGLLSGNISSTTTNTIKDNNTLQPDNTTNQVAPPSGTEIPQNLLEFGVDTSTNHNNIDYENIVYRNGVLSLSAINRTTEDIELQNIYINLYDNQKHYIKSIAIRGNLGSKVKKNYTFNILQTASFFTIDTVLEDDYTYIDLAIDANKISTLNCTLNNNQIKYSFYDEKLIKIEQTDSFSKYDNNYSEVFSIYNTVVIKYQNQSGVTVNLNEETEPNTFSASIDYKEYNGNLEGEYYFAKDSSPRKVHFLMEAILFDCK